MAALLAGAVVGGAGVVLVVAGVVTPRWLVAGDPGGHKGNGHGNGHLPGPAIHLGLWQACLSDTCVSVFDEDNKILSALGGWFYSVQALSVVSLVLALFAVLCILRYTCQSRNHLLRETGVLGVILSLCYGIGLLIFYIETGNDHLRDPLLSGLVLGEAFFLGVAAVIFCMVSAVLFCVHYNKQQGMRWEYARIN